MSGSQVSYEDPQAVYAQLNPQQRSTLAQEFIRGFQRSALPGAEPFASLDPKKVTPPQLAAMHQRAREEYPEVLGRAMRHPIVVALLGGFGANEINMYVNNRQAK